MFVINHKKIFFIFSSLLVVSSILIVSIFGLNLGIDFKGGSILEVAYLSEDHLAVEDLKINLQELNLGNITIQETIFNDSLDGANGIILRTKSLTELERQSILPVISQNGQYQIEQKRYNSIGPVIGEELKGKALWAILVVVLAIVLFVAFAFRKVTEVTNLNNKVSSWKYGFAAVIALVHDIVIPTGVFALLGHYFITYQIDSVFVMAILAILGFSVNDTIVVFDRIRENLSISKKEDFSETVGKSLKQTVTRSINTSLTTLIVLLVLYFWGGEATKQFALILSIGVVVGTYSSIFLASPLLTLFQKKK
jgi:preprotein translocase subunit SecF